MTGTSQGLGLDRPSIGGLRREVWIHIAILFLAALVRLIWLDHRPLHHDESIHAYYSWRVTTVGVSDYRYDPTYHGPALYYLTGLFHIVFGASDFSSRLFPAVCGLGLVALAWPLRPLIGREAALVYSALAAFSPTLVYYSRSLRHDVPMAFFTLAGVVALLHFIESRRLRDVYLAGVFAGLAFATKEDIYLTGFLFANILWLLAFASPAAEPIAARASAWGRTVVDYFRRSSIPTTTGILIALAIALTLYTSFYTHPENWNAVSRAIRYWWGQHEQQRIGGPWWYYLPLELFYEPLIFFAAVSALIDERVFRTTRVRAFFGLWTVLGFAIYAWAQEKVPWLLVPFLVPQAIVAAQFLSVEVTRRAFVAAPLAVYGLWAMITSSYVYDAPHPQEPVAEAHNEPLVYVQSTYDIGRVMKRIEEVTRALGTGKQTPMVVSGDATWPLSWYLREYSVRWGPLPEETAAPILIIDTKDAKRLGPDLEATHQSEPFQVRGWWQIDWGKATFSNLFGFLAYRRAWNPVGSTDAVLFVSRDLDPQGKRATVRLRPAPPVRKYSQSAEPLEQRRTLGGPGAGTGQLAEPRQMAFDVDGSLLVADSKNHRIQRFRSDGTAVAVYGGPEAGDAPGRFRDPGGVAVGPEGTIYVADTWNHRIQKLDRDGRFVAEWREENPGLWGPRAILVTPDEEIVVADTGNKRMLVYDKDGKRLRQFGADGSENGQFSEPVGLAFDPESRTLFVADTGNHRVQRFGIDGSFRSAWTASGWEEFYTEPYLWWTTAGLWATDSYNHRVNLYDPDKGLLLRSISGPKDGGKFERPIGVAVAANGEIYVADTMNHRIVVLAEAASPPALPTAP